MPTLHDEPGLAAFLRKQEAAVLALPIDVDGTIHGATLTYWHEERSLAFYFVTGKASEKCRLLQDGSRQKAALVVGANNGTAFTPQMPGTVQIVSKDMYAEQITGYTEKRGNSNDLDRPDSVLLQFLPTWARFTDFAKGWNTSVLDLEE